MTGGNYPWVAVDDYAKSGNEGYASTSSEVTLTIELNAGDTISFDYKVSSEANYDKFFFRTFIISHIFIIICRSFPAPWHGLTTPTPQPPT